jgi:poly(hydroxyalkanoate) granule-associated protein
MAEQPKKRVKIVAKKKQPTPEPQPDTPPGEPAAASGARKKEDKGLLDLQRWLDFPAGVAENARDVWMAGIGALSSVEEAGQALFDELVRKGERWEKDSRAKLVDARRQAGSAADKARAAAGELGRQPARLAADAEAQIQRMVEDSVEGVLHRLGVPTHEEVRELIERVETLSGKVDALMLRLQQAERAAPAGAASTLQDEPASGEVHLEVAPADGGWAVQEPGATRALSHHSTKAEAVAAARDRARAMAPAVLIVRKQDGTEQNRTTYGA